MKSTEEKPRPYTHNGHALDHNEDGRATRKRVHLAEAEKNWRGREDELEMVLRDNVERGHVFTAYCAMQVLRRLRRVA